MLLPSRSSLTSGEARKEPAHLPARGREQLIVAIGWPRSPYDRSRNAPELQSQSAIPHLSPVLPVLSTDTTTGDSRTGRIGSINSRPSQACPIRRRRWRAARTMRTAAPRLMRLPSRPDSACLTSASRYNLTSPSLRWPIPTPFTCVGWGPTTWGDGVHPTTAADAYIADAAYAAVFQGAPHRVAMHCGHSFRCSASECRLRRSASSSGTKPSTRPDERWWDQAPRAGDGPRTEESDATLERRRRHSYAGT